MAVTDSIPLLPAGAGMRLRQYAAIASMEQPSGQTSPGSGTGANAVTDALLPALSMIFKEPELKAVAFVLITNTRD
jgi:hypothetical protein